MLHAVPKFDRPNYGQCALYNLISRTIPSSLLSADRCTFICSKHLLITNFREAPMLYRFSPDQSIPALSPHCKLFPSLSRCLWCRLLRGNSLQETTGSSTNDLYPGLGSCFNVLHNSCFFFPLLLHISAVHSVLFQYNGSSVSSNGHWGTNVVVIRETFKKINTWPLVTRSESSGIKT